MLALRKSSIALSLLLIVCVGPDIPTTSAGESNPSETDKFKAFRFSKSVEAATRELNQLARDGWHYIGPLGNSLVAFRRSVKPNVDVSAIQGEWEYLSFEENGRVTEYKPESQLTLSISGDTWEVKSKGSQCNTHRVDISGRNFRSYCVAIGTPDPGQSTPPATIALGIYELKDDLFSYCTTANTAISEFTSYSGEGMASYSGEGMEGGQAIKMPASFETKGTDNSVFRLRRK